MKDSKDCSGENYDHTNGEAKPEIEVIINRLMGPTPQTAEDHVLTRFGLRMRLRAFLYDSIEVTGWIEPNGQCTFTEFQAERDSHRAIIPRALILPIEKEQGPTVEELLEFLRFRCGSKVDDLAERIAKHGIRKDGEK